MFLGANIFAGTDMDIFLGVEGRALQRALRLDIVLGMALPGVRVAYCTGEI